MANTLMFEVGIKSAQEQLDKIKQEFTKANGELSKLLKIKVSIDGVDAVTKALSQIGDTSALRNLRNEIAALNREFSILSKGAGGSGDIAGRGLAADIERTSQSIDRYTSKIKQLTEERSRLIGGTRNSSYQNFTDEILRYEQSLEGARNKLAQLNEQKNQSVASEPLKKATQDAQSFETALGRIETAIGSLKSGMSVNLTGDFSKWAQEVQNVTASVRELVEQLQKMQTVTATTAKGGLEPLLSQAQAIESLKNKYNELLKKKVDSAGIMPTIGIDRELKDLEQKLPSAQAKFNESLEKGASVANSYAQAIQQLGQKYNHTGEQAQKLAEIIASGQLSTVNVQRGLKVGFNQATDIVNTIEALQKLKQEESKPAPQGGLFDPQKFNTLQEAIDKIISEINRLQQAFTKLGENSSLSNLSTMINGLAVTLSTLSNAIKIQPLDEQVKALLERCEKAEAKLREVGDAAKYLNERAGAKTQQKASSIMGITGTDEEQLNKVSSTAERFMRLLVEIENQMTKIGKIQALGEQSGFSPTLLKNAQSQLEALKKMVESTIKGTPIAEGLVIPASNSQLAQFVQQFGLLKAQYRDVITEADRFNKVNEKESLKKKSEEMRAAASNMKEAANESRRLTETISNLEALASKAGALGIDTSKIRNVIDNLRALRSVMDDVAKNNSYSTKELKLEERFFKLKRMVKDVAQEIKKDMTAALKPDTEHANAFKEYISLLKQITSLTGTAKRAETLGIDTQTLRNQIALLENYANIIERFVGKKGVGFNAWMQATPVYGEARMNIASDQAKMNTAIANAKQTNVHATAQLSESEQRLANTIKGSTDSMRGQVNVLADLKTMATQYLGVWGAQQFMQNIIQIGGQLEQQRLSIGAILGDMAAGQHLFDQIKQLALTSPFGVMELDKDTKQLSAYGIKQSELFDMTKRLADISAGAGTEVSRLALALGHVRSEGALTGYTLRQFAMNNIPMLQKLSERLTKIEGQIVSTSEIRKRVSKKEIGYEDVIAVIKDLTNEGGMFFNMQETMAEAVNAKFKNLKDSMDIMYGEMAEGGIGSALKKVAESLMFLTRNWEETARVVGYGTAAFVAYRIAVASANTQLMTYGSTVGITSRTLNAKAIALGVNTAAVRRLTASEVGEMVTLKLLSREQLLNAVATKKLTVDQAELAAATFGVTRAELTSVASKGKLGIVASGLGLRLRSLALSIRGVGVALKSMLLNPVGIALMAITGAFEVFMRWKQRNEEIEKSIEQLGQKGSEGYKNLAATMEKYSGGNGKMSESEYSTAIGDIIDQLKNYAPNIHNIQEEAQSIDSLAGRYEYLRGELESTKNAYADLERTKSFASNANEATGNMLNDTFTENVEEYIDNVQKVDKAEQELMQHRVALEKTLDELEKGTSFKRRTDENGNVMSLVEQLKYIRSTDWNRVFSPLLYSNSQGASAALSAYSSALTQMEERMRNEVMPDLQNFASRLNNQYAGTFGKDWKENADHIKTAWMAVVSEIEKVPGMTDNVKRELLEKIFNETWHMNINFSTGEITESLTGWRKEMQDWLDENGLKFRIGFNDSREDIYKKAKAAQEAAQTEMNNAGQVLIGIGFKLNNLPSTLPSPLATPWNQKNLEDYNEQKNINELWEKFQKHFSANWQTKQDKANNKKGSQEDKDARRLREIIKLYKDAYEWYTKYEKQVGESSALKRVQEQFKPLFDQFKDQFKQELSLDSIPLYKENLESLLDEAEKLYKNPKHKNSYMVEAIKQIRDAINNVDYEELGRKQDEFLSKSQIQLDDLTREWDRFNKVREATGNVELAKQISGAEYQAGQTRNLADALKKNIEEGFADIGSIGIPFDISLDDKKIENRIKEIVPKESEDKIKGLVEQYKKWRDLQRDVLKSDIDVFGKLMGSVVDYDSQLEKINDEYDKQKDSLDEARKSGAISLADYEKALSILDTNADTKRWKASQSYIDLMNKSLAMTRDEIDSAAKTQEEMLNKNLETGLITIQQYSEEMEKLRNIQREYNRETTGIYRSAFTAYMTKGTEGLSEYYKRQSRIYHELYDKAPDKNSSEAQGYLKKAERYDDMSDKQIKLADDYDKMAGALNKMKAAVDMATMVLEAFGEEDATLSTIGDMFGGISRGASAGSAFGTYGTIIGGVLGGMVGLAAHGEKETQKLIEELQANAKALEANTSMIESNRSRTLGYDTGDLRREMLQLQKNRINNGEYENIVLKGYNFMDPVGEAMRRYYYEGSALNGYQQQLATLKQMKTTYENMYTTEEGKKSASESALEEYKQKIAELEDQIIYFTEDLARELWDIDFKSWASQISDALWTAFENGEDAMEAFHDAANDIIADVAKKMMNIHLIEPAFKELETMLFGGIDSNGNVVKGAAYDETTGKWNEEETLRILGKFFGEDGEFAKVINSAESFYRMAEQVSGSDFKGDSSSSSMSNTIKGITEQTADLIASYISAIRLDVSVNRAAIAQYFPLFYQALTSHNSSLTNIENNTAAIMRSNEAIASHVADLQSDIRGLKNKAWKMPIA